jgi:hypothetical protein
MVAIEDKKKKMTIAIVAFFLQGVAKKKKATTVIAIVAFFCGGVA